MGGVAFLRPRKIKRLLTLFVLIPFIFLIAGAVYFVYTYYSIDLARQLEEPSIILDRDGRQVSRYSSEIRQVVSLDEISPFLVDATLAIEDARFYQHFGLDPRGLARALWHNLRKGRVVEGGSTITQQLAENEYFLSVSGPARSLGKKIKEAVYAIKLERTYTKNEILERYLNRIYFGHGRFGVEAAAQYYFGKSARDVTLSEAAMLAGI
ncbi:MAG TPA: penicillin-binding protein, partial [Firmicutes bacterium]|nr:penicillin-binding protein [Bacillota bacterium]